MVRETVSSLASFSGQCHHSTVVTDSFLHLKATTDSNDVLISDSLAYFTDAWYREFLMGTRPTSVRPGLDRSPWGCALPTV